MAVLSQIEPDVQSLVSQLQSELQTSDTWKDLYEDATGEELIELFASVGAFLHFALAQSIRETFPITANLDSSIRAASVLLGDQPRRKIGARATVALELSEVFAASVSIPALSQFEIDGKLFYNASEVVFTAGNNRIEGIVLEQGEIVTEPFIGTGQNAQLFVLTARDFEANENLMLVTVNGDDYDRQRESLYQFAPTDKVFLEITFPDGSVGIRFPTSSYGVVPSNGSAIVVQWARTLGLQGNSAGGPFGVTLTSQIDRPGGVNGSAGYISLNTDLSLTSGAISQGGSEESSDDLRVTSPRIFASGKRAITRSDQEALAVKFPNLDLADALAYGEQELLPEDNTRMNVVNLVLLRRVDDLVYLSRLTPLEKVQFLAYAEDLYHETTRIRIIDPDPLDVTVNADIYVLDGFDLAATTANVTNAVVAFFERNIGSLGRGLFLSDLYNTINDVEGVDYLILNSPVADIPSDLNQFLRLDPLVLVNPTITAFRSTR